MTVHHLVARDKGLTNRDSQTNPCHMAIEKRLVTAHLRARGCPLQGAKHYPHGPAHCKRFDPCPPKKIWMVGECTKRFDTSRSARFQVSFCTLTDHPAPFCGSNW